MHSSHINRDTVAMIFRSMRGRFGTAFVDKFRSGKAVPHGQPDAGKDTGLLEAMDIWAHELRDLTQADIEHGMSHKFKWPPSADEFVTACIDSRMQRVKEFPPALPRPPRTEAEKAKAKEFIAKLESLINDKVTTK